MLWHTLHQLKSKDPEVRRKAVLLLYQTPNERAARVLAAMLDDSDAEVRRLTAMALGKMEDERRIEPLIRALRDRDATVVQAAAAALKKARSEQVVCALEPLLRHSDAAVRGQAAQSLEAAGWRPSDREQEIWYRVAKGQLFQAAGFGVEAVPALELALAGGSSGTGVAAIEALAHIDDPTSIRPVFGALRSPDPAICIAAVTALSRAGAAEAVAPVYALLKSRNPQIRAVAVEGLGRLQAAEALEAISGLLQDSQWEVRRQAAETLGRFRDARAVGPLSAALADSDGDVREAAAMSLGNLGDARAIGPLVLALKDPSSSVRRIAAATLSRIDTDWSSLPEARAAAEELKPALHDHDPGVRHFVGHLLAAISGAQSSSVPLAAGGEFQPEQRRKMAVKCFLQILADPDRDLRQAAAEALGQLADQSSHLPLTRACSDPDPGVRRSATLALRNFQPSPA
ncbi:MAG TPA: HEAT repeat domain-containing protein [Verrucomicrobiae bacterium]|nr:HEAT repeat domain-containing protein [Verrucomicrobiae bacterium]